jgi:hypothetical protein
MVNWTASWFTPDGSQTVSEVADQLAEMAVQSVGAREDRTAAFGDAASALNILRQDLDQLALLIDRRN